MTLPFIILGIVVIIIVMATLSVVKLKKTNKEQIKKKQEIERVINEKKKVIQISYAAFLNVLENSYLSNEHFFAYSEMERLRSDTMEIFNCYAFLDEHKALSELQENELRLYSFLKDINNLRISHNQDFINKELKNNKEYFDTLLSNPLDDQQRKSIVNLEDNCLVVSSAGSGKTSTMVGKVLYLVNIRNIQPSRILTITYTHKAADELSQRLLGTGISCLTFHKLAINIVSKVEGLMPAIADPNLFVRIFFDMMHEPSFRKSIQCYLADFKSLVKDEHSYKDSAEYYRDRKKYGVIALYPDKDGHIIRTKSEEEKKICNYLTELGVAFTYEEPYEINTLTEEYRQYRPDFTIYYKDRDGVEKKLYLEHFALDSAGQVPIWFGQGQIDGWASANRRYHDGIIWKMNLHDKNNTTLISTRSADFHSGTIRGKLRRMLEEHGVPIHEKTSDELLQLIMSKHKSVENALMQMAQSFINLVKCNGKTIDEIRECASKQSPRDVFVIDNIMKPLWNKYQQELENRSEMDFADIINKATHYCEEGKWNTNYDFILVDEFQDISIDRYRLLKALRTESTMTKLYCVGDDWQSIYRFSGSDITLFSQFSKFFGHADECKIETTYRFGNPLIMESSTFIQHNPLQKTKSIKPRPINPPETKLSFKSYKDNDELQSLLERMVLRVPEDKSVYIISRYSYDIKDLDSSKFKMDFDRNSDNVVLTIGNRKVKFMTIHGSKGLEADYVIMLNCNSGLYGFPSLVSDDPVLDYVMSEPEHFEYAEERRVFYVGITRAKIHTVVLYNVNNPSPFVTEMMPDIHKDYEHCPWCKEGHRVLKYEGWTKQNTPYRVWGCDNIEANCQYFEREFSGDKYMHLKRKMWNS